MGTDHTDFFRAAARLCDIDLCDRIGQAVLDRVGDPLEPEVSIPVEWRVPGLIAPAQIFCEDEGFEAMFSLAHDRPGQADALDLIDLPAAAWALRRLTARLEDPIEGFDESIEDLLGDVSDLIQQYQQATDDSPYGVWPKLAAYVRQHLDAYLPLADALVEQAKPGDAESPNIGFLNSVHFWVRDFADKHDGRLPRWAELREFMHHIHLRQAEPGDYEILLTGQRDDHPEYAPLAVWNQPVFGQRYQILLNGETVPPSRS